MAERSGSTPLGCLGRILSLVGLAWIVFVLLVGVVSTADGGVDPESIGGLGVLVVPAVAIIAIGRAIRRRARRRAEEEAASSAATPTPDRPRESAPTPPPMRRSAPPFPPVATDGGEVAEELLEEPEPAHTHGERSEEPKSSQEMIEEAKKRWSSGL